MGRTCFRPAFSAVIERPLVKLLVPYPSLSVKKLQIFRNLDKFGRENEQPMFVITKLEFRDFISTVLCKKIPKDLVEKLLSDLSPVDRTREIDFLIIHRHVGIILIEVKAMEKFRKPRYCDAKKQLDVGEKFIQSFLHTIVPVFKVVAMPNVHAIDRDQEATYISLCSEHLGTDINFTHWWHDHFNVKNFSPETEQELLNLTAVLVGQRASVCATASILDDVYKIIDKQAFLEKSFIKQMRRMNEATAIKKTATEPQLATLKKQFLFLNPEQLFIWDGSTQQILCGAPGSGKTILLQHKAFDMFKKTGICGGICTTST